MFSACAVTQAMSKRKDLSEDDIDLSDNFLVTEDLGLSVVPPPSDNLSSDGAEGGEVERVGLGNVSVAREQLVCEQGTDPELSSLVSSVSADESLSVPRGYLVEHGELMCKGTLYVWPDDCDYLIATPDQNRRSRPCDVNILKPYHECEAGPGSDCVASSPAAVTSVVPSVELSSAHFGGFACAVEC